MTLVMMLVLPLLWPATARGNGEAGPVGDPTIAAIERDANWLASHESRLPGRPGHARVERWLIERIEALGDAVTWWEHRFPIMMPDVQRDQEGSGRAMLSIADGPHAGRHAIHPLWPASVRLNATPPGGLDGRLVYIGDASPQRIPPRSLRGQVAVAELSSGRAWTGAFSGGASALILLGSDEVTWLDAQAHLLHLPIHAPRFYLPDGPLADALRQGEVAAEVHLDAPAKWRQVEAANLYALVHARRGAPPQPALTVMVRRDGMSIVPDQAPDATAAVNTATAVALMEQLARRPPSRPVLFAFVDAYGINQVGARRMFQALVSTPREARFQLDEDRRLLQRTYAPAAALARELGDGPDALAVLHRARYRVLHRYVRDEVNRRILAVESVLHPLRLQAHSPAMRDDEALQRRIEVLDRQRRDLHGITRALLDPPRTAEEDAALTEAQRERALELWQAAYKRIVGQHAEAEARLARFHEEDGLRQALLAALGLGEGETNPLAFVLGLDLSDSGVVAGPMLTCGYLGQNEVIAARDLARWLRGLDQQRLEAMWPGEVGRAVSLEPLGGQRSVDSYNVAHQPTLTSAAQSFGVAAMTWSTLSAAQRKRDTPADTAEHLHWPRLVPQVRAAMALVREVADDEQLLFTAAITPRWNRVRGQIVDRSPGEPLPRLAMPGKLVALVPGNPSGPGQVNLVDLPASPGMRRLEFARTGADGRFHYDAWPGHVAGTHTRYVVQAWQLGEGGRIERAVDQGTAGRALNWGVNVQERGGSPLRALLFDCEEVSLTDLYDPRFLLHLGGSLLDAREFSEPRRLNLSFHQGLMAAQVDPGLRWQVLLRAGVGENRLALLNMLDPAEADVEAGAALTGAARRLMRGFEIGQPRPRHHLHQSAQDLLRLNDLRLADYERTGIRSEAIRDLQQRTRRLLDEAEAALAADDGGAYHAASAGALANEVRSYQAVRDTANDVIRGAIFLLLALAPFSYAMERLLMASPNIYRQIGGTALIFTVMTAVLWSFHPAFRISSQPLMVIMAFAVILMSLLVLAVVYRRFEVGLEELRSGRAEASGAATSRVGVLATAVRLGIANMRKRKLRTTLTGVTIVLITFALLCFMSTTRYAGSKELELLDEAAYTGILLRQPGNRAFPERMLPELRTTMGGEAEPAARRWWINPTTGHWRIGVRHEATGHELPLRGALGLAAHDPAIAGRHDGGGEPALPNWEAFARGDGAYLVSDTAASLGAEPGDAIIVAGHRLTLLGTIESRLLDVEVRDLDEVSLLPTDYTVMDDAARALMLRQDVTLIADEIAGGAGMDVGSDLPVLASGDVVIVHESLLRGLENAELRSIAVPLPDGAAATKHAHELAHRIAYSVFFGGRDEGVRAMATTPLLPQAPRSVLIPLAIGGLIIFNTMLSAIAERRREIYVYTSLGLAPLHVGFLFLAEAVTYGLMGTVFGYVVGQGVATVLSHLGWMGGITLNYSGTQAIMVMVMVLGVVVVSSLVPAYLGGRMAAPANERTWQVPPPEGDVIRDTLPFTATPRTAPGLMQFLAEYMDAHREGSIGHFSTDRLQMALEPLNGDAVPVLRATVWLAPFDLGVRQEAMIVVQPTGEEDVWQIDVELVRGAGQTEAWWKLNRVFLRDLRRQLLGWRKLPADRVVSYIEAGRAALERTGGGAGEAGEGGRGVVA